MERERWMEGKKSFCWGDYFYLKVKMSRVMERDGEWGGMGGAKPFGVGRVSIHHRQGEGHFIAKKYLEV